MDARGIQDDPFNQKLSQFLMATGETNTCTAFFYLRMYGGDMDRALAEYYTHTAASDAGTPLVAPTRSPAPRAEQLGPSDESRRAARDEARRALRDVPFILKDMAAQMPDRQARLQFREWMKAIMREAGTNWRQVVLTRGPEWGPFWRAASERQRVRAEVLDEQETRDSTERFRAEQACVDLGDDLGRLDLG